MAQAAARRELRERQASQGVPPQVPLAPSSLPVLARVSRREPPVRELQLALALQAQASRLRAPEHVVLTEPPLALGPLASPPLVDELGQPDEQQGPPLVPGPLAAAQLPSQPPLSPSARLPPRFPRRLHPADDA